MQDVSQHFVIPLNSYNEMGNCVLNETERKVFVLNAINAE